MTEIEQAIVRLETWARECLADDEPEQDIHALIAEVRRLQDAESCRDTAVLSMEILAKQRDTALAERDKFHRAYTEVNARSTDAVIAQGERVSRIEAERDTEKAQVTRLTSELAFVRNEAAGFNTAWAFALERVESERDAALAERDAARATAQQDRELHDARSARRIKRIDTLEAALTEARRVLREVRADLDLLVPVAQTSELPITANAMIRISADIAAVLAQEETR